MKLTVIQDIATPHNNVLLQAAEADPEVDLTLWYCQPKADMYGWKEDLTHAVKPARLYSKAWPDIRFLAWCLRAREQTFVIVGWMNINTRILLVLFWLLRRPFNMWFDLPHEGAPRNPIKRALRAFYYFLLKTSRARVFGIGTTTVDYFVARGFDPARVFNLPIFVELVRSPQDYRRARATIRKQYGAEEGSLMITAGSRLIKDKGFDLLIDALGMLTPTDRQRVRCVIVGKGPERDALLAQCGKLGLDSCVTLVDWMDIEDFCELIAAGDVFVHPARFDAYGSGTLLAMGVGVPVIGTLQARSAADRIEEGVNGYLYDCEDTIRLASLLTAVLDGRENLTAMGKAARATAEVWRPDMGVEILKRHTL